MKRITAAALAAGALLAGTPAAATSVLPIQEVPEREVAVPADMVAAAEQAVQAAGRRPGYRLETARDRETGAVFYWVWDTQRRDAVFFGFDHGRVTVWNFKPSPLEQRVFAYVDREAVRIASAGTVTWGDEGPPVLFSRKR